MAAIRSIERALSVLRLMNQHRSCKLHELRLEADLPAPTVYRILRTLRRAGYVRAEGGGYYRVTEKVRELGCGYTEQSLVVDLAAPILRRVTRQIRWPLAIGVLDGDAIRVRYSTMPYSPLAVQATTLGHRLGLLESAMGLAYLACCAAPERDILIALLCGAALAGTDFDAQRVDELLVQTRRRGYGLRLPQRRGASATVAVAICARGEVVAILSMTTFGRAMTQATLAKFVPVLRQTAAEIARCFVQSQAGER